MSERNPILVELCEAIGYHAAQIAATGEMAPNTWLMRTLDKVEAALAAAPVQAELAAMRAVDAKRYLLIRNCDADMRNKLEHYASDALDIVTDAAIAAQQGDINA